MDSSKITLFSMPNSNKLALKVSKDLKIPLSKINFIEFADGEKLLSSESTVRNKHVFIIASTCRPANENIMQLLLFVDSLKRASANTITVVLSYYGYARQDRKVAGRQPIGAKLIADLLEKAGVTKVIAVDLHNPSIQGFFNIPMDDLKGQYILAPIIKKKGKEFTIVSPDHGGAVRARLLSELLHCSKNIAIVDKRRTGTNQSETLGILGDVKNNDVVIVDDMIDTGGTIIKAAKALKDAGAKKIIIVATHGIFSKGFDEFDKSDFITEVIVTDSIESVYEINSKKINVISLDKMVAKSIQATINSESISEFYDSIRKKI